MPDFGQSDCGIEIRQALLVFVAGYDDTAVIVEAQSAMMKLEVDEERSQLLVRTCQQPQDGARQLSRLRMPGARQDLAREGAQGPGGGHVSHVRPSLRCLAFDFASWQSVFPNVLFAVFCFP